MRRLATIMLVALAGPLALPGTGHAAANDEPTTQTIPELENERLRKLLDMADLLRRNDDYPGAIGAFRKALALPTTDKQLRSRTNAYGDWIAARALVIKVDPELVLALLDDYEAWLGDTHTYPSQLWWLRSIALGRLGRTDEADRLAAHALAHNPTDAKYHMSVGFFLGGHALHEPAIAEFEHALPHAETDRIAGYCRLGLAAAHLGLEHYEDSVSLYEQSLAVLGQPTPRNNLAYAYQDAAHACRHLGRYHELRGKLGQTVAANERALALMPDELDEATRNAFADNICAIGEAYVQLDQPDKALEHLLRAIEMVPDAAGFWSTLGDAYAKAGDEAKTQEAYAKCIELYRDWIETRPTASSPYNGLAWHCATHDEHLDEALELSTKSLELAPDTPEYLDTLAEIYYRLGKHDEAIEWITKALALDPKPHHLLYYEQQLAKFEAAKQNK